MQQQPQHNYAMQPPFNQRLTPQQHRFLYNQRLQSQQQQPQLRIAQQQQQRLMNNPMMQNRLQSQTMMNNVFQQQRMHQLFLQKQMNERRQQSQNINQRMISLTTDQPSTNEQKNKKTVSGDVRNFQPKPSTIPPNTETVEEEEEIITSYKSLPYRPWANVSRSQSGQSSNAIRILSWNVMPKNCMYRNKLLKGRYKAYQTIPNYYAMNYRKDMLINEIVRNQPDIFCLQCVDQIHFFQEIFAPKGFCSIYEQTTCPSFASTTVYWGDGLAVFWQTKKFDLIGYKKYTLGDINYVCNIALVVRLKIRNNEMNDEIDIWNTRLIEGMRPSDEQRRVKQCQMLFECISNASNTNILSINEISDDTHVSISDDLFMKRSKYPSITDDNKEEEEKMEENDELSDVQRIFINKLQSRMKAWNDTTSSHVNMNVNVNVKKDMATIKRNLGIQYGTGGTIYYNTSDTQVSNDDDDADDDKLQRPVIVCCDFNSTTIHDYEHGIYPYTYSYLTRKSRTTQANDLYQSCLHHMPPHKMYPWFLQSAYALGFCNDPPYTQYVRYWTISYALQLEKIRAEKAKKSNTYHYDVDVDVGGDDGDGKKKNTVLDFSNTKTIVRCSDAILFTPQNFRVLALYSTISPKWVEAHWNKCLPNQNYPSDHLMLGVVLEYVHNTKDVSVKPKDEEKDGDGKDVEEVGDGQYMAQSSVPVHSQPMGVQQGGFYQQPMPYPMGSQRYY